MSKIFEEISKATKGNYGEAVLYAGAIGLVLSDIIPTPADALYFYTERKLRDQFNNRKITPKQYWIRSASAYYLYNPIWWLLVLGAMHYKEGDYKAKAKVGLALIGAGAVIGVIYRNYKKDIEEVKQDAFATDTKVNFDATPQTPKEKAKNQKFVKVGNRIKIVNR